MNRQTLTLALALLLGGCTINVPGEGGNNGNPWNCNPPWADCDDDTGDTSLIDEDGDGFYLYAPAGQDADCDDTDADINPGATDICDGLDNNCDGEIDEGSTTWYPDYDGDGWGDENSPIQACEAPADHTDEADDCDDTDPDISPDAVEVCGNGIDDNCTGNIDENCP